MGVCGSLLCTGAVVPFSTILIMSYHEEVSHSPTGKVLPHRMPLVKSMLKS